MRKGNKELTIIETCNLSYVYSKDTPFEKIALDKINLSIKKGSFVGIIGHTGSGKSTLVQHFNGLLKPSKGKIYIEGKDMWAKREEIYKYRFKIGLVFQYPEHQLFEETVFKDIAFGPKNMGLKEEEIERRVKMALKIVGMPEEYLERSPFELSGGQKRKVALAGIISMDPQVLVLDEPTAGLDPRSKRLLLDNIKTYHEEKKNTIILISHNMDDIAKLCDKVILMKSSRINKEGGVDKIFEDVEGLVKMGIVPPTIREIFYRLSDRGYDINKNINTISEAVEYLKKLRKNK